MSHGPGGYLARQTKRARLGKLKSKTVHDYKRIYTLHIEGSFASVPFDEIDDADDLTDWVESCLRTAPPPRQFAIITADCRRS